MIEFTVSAERTKSGWRVCVRNSDNGDFGEVFAGDIDTAMRMATPYMAAVACPSPIADLIANVLHWGS